ncbi:MAG: RNA 2'-phosphotransferase [Solobacterium sp.]|nr:RNA 2'-phosphotransferase [Solobacterium sp.]
MSLRNTSKFISLILRHKPETIGITLDEHGWADVDALIEGISRKHTLNMEILEQIVREDEKNRYSFNEDHTKIRANHGHSIPVDVELKEGQPPEILFHGTGVQNIASIEEKGLVSMNRLYVHLSSDTDTAYKVGRRHGRPVIFTVLSGKMHEDGYHFFLSGSGIWLTECVPPQYLRRN